MKEIIFVICFFYFMGVSVANEEKRLEYIDAMMLKDWESLYNCKSDKFKRIVEYDLFAQTMEKEHSEFKIVDYEVHDSEYLKGIEVTKYSADLMLVETGEVKSFSDKQVLVQDLEGKSLCVSLGLDFFYSLNRDITYSLW